MTELHWPTRVWERDENGWWTSHPPTAEDMERRREVAREWPKCPEQWKRATDGLEVA